MAGGKLTTAPSFARRTLRRVAQLLGRSLTDDIPEPEPWEWAANSVPDRLSSVYGRRAARVQQFCISAPGLAAPLDPDCETARGEVLYAIEEERARTLGDILLRRTGAAFSQRYKPAWARAAAEVAAGPLGWDETGIDAALSDFEAELARTLVRV